MHSLASNAMMLRLRTRLWALPLAALALGSLTISCAVAQDTPAQGVQPHDAIERLADDVHEWGLVQFPENATLEGDHRFDDQITDLSPDALSRRRAQPAVWQARLAAIDSTHLSLEDHLSFEILRRQIDDQLAEIRLLPEPFSRDDEPIHVTQLDNPVRSLVALAQATRFSSRADYANYQARLQKLPAQLDQTIALLKLALAAGWTAPKAAVARVPAQFASILSADPAHNAVLQPFTQMPASIAVPDQAAIRNAAIDNWQHNVIPALTRLQHFYRDGYLPHARTDPSIASLPGGDAWYQLQLRESTTTNLSAADIHKLGVEEVARIDLEMARVRAAIGYKGNAHQFNQWINSDARFQFKSADDLLDEYRATAKRIDAELPRLFFQLPRTPYGIRLMQPDEGDGSEYYSAGAEDGSRAGFVNVNGNNLKTHPRWGMETLELHEGMPGHHLQVSRAQELSQLSEFRRNYWNNAYGEGWAVYAETLGYEIGLYKDPFMNYGHLSDEILRASRLVVDTGLHAFHMTRSEAIDYMHEHTAMAMAEIEAEVDRYTVSEGQATAYKVGALHIQALRRKAETALGPRFDERKFHNAVIDHGALPLDLLDETIDQWISEESHAPADAPKTQ